MLSRPPLAAALLSTLVALAAGCATSLQPDPRRGGYALEARGRRLELSVLPGTRGRRFQGTITAHKGHLLGAIVSRVELKDRVAVEGDVVQFDLEPAAGVPDRIELAVSGGCVKLELLIDGRMIDHGVRRAGVRLDRRSGALVACGGGEQ